jgi:hypothetical protein
MVFLALLLPYVAPASAEVPLPDYRDVVVQRTWHDVDSLIEAACSGPPGAQTCNEEPLVEAIQTATAFQDVVTEDARLEYLLGLAYLSKGDRAAGRAHLEGAVQLDPDRPDAWHDLGEVYLQDGQMDEAGEAFGHVTRLVDSGSKAWLGPWRQAEVAAHQGDPEAFETHMKLALKRGFTFRTIRGLPNWRRFYADPRMQSSIRKMVTVYGTPDVLESLEAAPDIEVRTDGLPP